MLIQLAPGWVFKMRTDSLPRGQSKNYVLFFFVYKERVLTKIQPSCGNICKKYKDKKLHKQNLNKIYRPYWTPDCGRCEDLPNFSSLCIPLWWQQPRRGAWFELIYELLSISVLGVLEMQGSLTQVGVSAVDVSLTQLTPFRSRTFTPIEIISFSKTFCVATWLNYTPFAPCGHRKSRAIKKIAVYISRIFQNSTFKPWFFVVKKINL